MIWRHLAVGVLFVGAALLVGALPSHAQSFEFTSIDVPCGNCLGGVAPRTVVLGINPRGDIVGNYTDAVGKVHGFLLSDGEYTSIDVPGELVGTPGTLPTSALGISPSGEIVGQFTAPYNPPVSTSVGYDSPAYCLRAGAPECIKGFLYRHGEFSPVLFPGHPGAIPAHITEGGSIYGCLHDFDLMGSMFSASRTRDGDTRSLMAGGGELADDTMSYPNSMHRSANPDGSIIVGFYVDMMVTPNHQHGYLLQDGVLQTWDVPNSTSTVIWDINARLEFVGGYFDSTGRQHGFLQLPHESAPITVDVPSTPPFNSGACDWHGITPDGTLAGAYTDTQGHTHGVLAVPADGNRNRNH